MARTKQTARKPTITRRRGLKRALNERPSPPVVTPAAPATTDVVQQAKKRRLNDAQCSSATENFGEPPLKTFKVNGSSEFVCQEFFLKGSSSDVVVHMLEEKWKLHKKYVMQSPYFAELISKSRQEPVMCFSVSINDTNITKTALLTAISSLYTSEVKFNSNELVSVLAAAKLFQLDGLVKKCEEIFMQNVSLSTATQYLAVAGTYKMPALELFVRRWLSDNLLTRGSDKLIFLKGISVELMASLLSDPELIPFKCEMDKYKMLKKWLFTKLQNDLRNANPDKFFEVQQWKSPFLRSEEGKKYLGPFQALKMRHMLLDLSHSVADALINDKIIPGEWIMSGLNDNWKILGLISSNEFQWPNTLKNLNFEKESYKCCYFFDNGNQDYYLFGKEFLYGVNLSFSLSTNESAVVVSRDFGEKERYVAASQPNFNFAIKVSLKWLDAGGSVKKEVHSGLKLLTLNTGEEKNIMSVDSEMSYPVFLIVKLLVHPPLHIESN